MGKLVVEASTYKHQWVCRKTFSLFCRTIKDIVSADALETLILVLTDVSRKNVFLSGMRPSYTTSFVFNEGASDIAFRLAKEPKIFILDDQKTPAFETREKLYAFFTSLLLRQHHHEDLKIEMQYHVLHGLPQVYPVDQHDLVYLLGRDEFLGEKQQTI